MLPKTVAPGVEVTDLEARPAPWTRWQDLRPFIPLDTEADLIAACMPEFGDLATRLLIQLHLGHDDYISCWWCDMTHGQQRAFWRSLLIDQAYILMDFGVEHDPTIRF